MDNFDIIKQALEDTLKLYLIEQHDGTRKEKGVLNPHLFAEQLQMRIEKLSSKHLKHQAKDIEMMQMMKQQGGSFVRSLAAAMLTADTENYAKLVDAFPEYVADYRKRAQEAGLKAK